MQLDFSAKAVLITGAGGAIGRAMGLQYAQSGAWVAVCDVNEAAGRETVAAIEQTGGRGAFFHLDVTDRGEARRTAREVAAAFGGIDVLVNNAGVNVGPDQRFPIDTFGDESWDRIVSVDLDGVYAVTKAVVPYMAGRAGANILNISSVVGLVPFRNQCAFAAAKAGVVNLTKAMALELAPRGLRANVIAPGSIAMPGTAALFTGDSKMEAMLSHVPLHRQGSGEDIAHAALFLTSEQAGYITGAVLTVDGGWTCGFARDF